MKKTAKTKKNVAARKTSANLPASKIAAAVGAVAVASTVLVLRTCAADMSSYNGFRWPEAGTVSAPDWNPQAECGNGLHGLLWGEGNGQLLSWEPDARWLVVEVEASQIVDLVGKVKFPSGVVVHCGTRETATAFLGSRAPGRAIVGGTATAGYSGTATAGDSGTATAGDRGTATAGYSGTATAGDSGTATAGYSGTATAGYNGTATAGDRGTATAGYNGTATAGDRGTATAGYSGTATAGDSGTATAGDRGTATAGYSGTATAGDSGTATAGYSGTATAGDRGTLILSYWDSPAHRRRYVIGYVGENGIEPKTKYCLDEQHCFKKVD